MLVEVFEPPAQRYFEEGCAIATHEHKRQFPAYKTTNYIQAVLLQGMKKEKNILEVAYVAEGKMLEATGSNLFVVKRGTIATPKDDILHGITRKVVLDVTRDELPLEERAVSIEEMFDADELFLTSSFKDVVPVTQVDGRAIGSGTPGPITRRVMDLFQGYARASRA